MVRGEVLRLPAPSRPRGHRQRGARYAVVVQADEDCQESVGSLVRMSVKTPKEDQTEVGFNGDNPVFQPLTLGQ